MATLVGMIGGEWGGVASTSGSGLFTALSGSATKSIDATTKFNSAYSLKIVASSNYGLFQMAYGGSSPTYSVGVAYVYFDSLPAATDYVFFRVQTVAGGNFSFAYNNSTGKMRAIVTGGTAQTGPDMTTGVWYRIEWRAYCGSTTGTLDWQVGIEDGAATAYTQATATITSSTFTLLQFGNSSVNATWTGYCDNIVWSQTSGDYPIGPVRVEGIRPSSEGTDSLGSVITDEDGLTSNLYAKLSESPWTTTANDDLIKQTGTGTSSYAEVNFADTTRTTIFGAKAYLQYASSATQSNQGACIIIDEDTTQTEVYGNPTTRQDYSETSAFYKSALLPVPSGGWDQAAVNALKARVGYSGDATPNPYWLGLMVEVAVYPGTIVNLVPDSTGYQTNAGDNATLGVTIDFVPDSTGYHSQLGDNATLGVTIDLVPDSTGYQTQLGDNATLEVSSVIDLVPDQTGYQSQAGDNTTLATELKHTVAPSGGDFTSLDAALDHLVSAHPNLVTANVFAVIEIQGSWSSADTTLASTAGITMDESHPIIIRANSANRASAQGWRTDRYRLSVSGGDRAIYLTGGEVHIHLDGLQIELTGVTSTGVTAIHCDGCSPGSTVKVSNVRARMACESAGSGFIFGFADADPIYTVWNLIAEPHPSNAGTVRGYYLGGPGTAGASKAYNCLGVNLNYAYRTANTDSWCIYDSIAVNCGDDFYGVIGDFYEVDNCASDDNEGTNNVAESGGGTWWTDDFIDAQNGDYRLKSTSNLVGAATHNLGGNATDDIDGQTRSDYDLGPSESVVVDMVPDSTGYQTQLGDNATLEVLGGAIDLVPDQTGYQTQLGDSPTLGVTIDLVPDSTGYQTQLGDSPTLGVTIDLVPDGTGYQTQLGDSPTLGVTIDLVPDSTGYQTQLGDNTTIEVGIIAIEPDQTGYQTQLGDNATLGVTIDLVPDSTGYQTQLGDNATLTINAIDIVPDQTGYQSQLGDNAVIERIFNLIASEGSQTQLGDGATLDLIINLLVQEGSQTQAGDEAALIQIHNLITSEGFQTQLGDNAALIMGVLHLHEIIERVLIRDGIETIRTGRSAETGIFLELVQVQGRIKTVRKRRIQ